MFILFPKNYRKTCNIYYRILQVQDIKREMNNFLSNHFKKKIIKKTYHLLTKKTVFGMKSIHSNFPLISTRNDQVQPPITTSVKRGINSKITIKVELNIIQCH